MVVIPGPVVTVKVDVLLGPLFTVTRTGPVVVPSDTASVIFPEAQLAGAVKTPFIVTKLVP
jgi:hypothetical protein